MPPGAEHLCHGTCVALGAHAALLRAPPGGGKSDLALRFLALPPSPLWGGSTPRLVADDQVLLTTVEGRLMAAAPPVIQGCIEVRGVGIVRVGAATRTELALLIDLVAPGAVERLPGQPAREAFLGVALPVLRLAPFEASAPVKLALLLAGAIEQS